MSSRGKKTRRANKQTHVANNPKLQFAKSGAFVPSRTRVSLRFAVNFAVAASTTSATAFLSGNDMKAPGLSLSSSKCVGFSYWASLYGRYRVYGSKLSIRTVMSSSLTAGTAKTASGAVVIYPTNTGATTTLFADAMSQPYAKWTDITAATPKSLTCVAQTSKLSGQKDFSGSDRMQALVTADPADQWYWAMVYVADANYADMSVVVDAQVTYDCEFFDRLEINRSSLALFDKAFELRCAEAADNKQVPARPSGLIVLENKAVVTGEDDDPDMVSVSASPEVMVVPRGVMPKPLATGVSSQIGLTPRNVFPGVKKA